MIKNEYSTGYMTVTNKGNHIVTFDFANSYVEPITIDISKIHPGGMFSNNLPQYMINGIDTWIHDPEVNKSRYRWVKDTLAWLKTEYKTYMNLENINIPDDVESILDRYFMQYITFEMDMFCDGRFRIGTPDNSPNGMTHFLPYPEYNEYIRLTYWNDGSIWIDAYAVNLDSANIMTQHHYEIAQIYVDAFAREVYSGKYYDEDDPPYQMLDKRSMMFRGVNFETDDIVDIIIRHLRGITDYTTSFDENNLYLHPTYKEDYLNKYVTQNIHADTSGNLYTSGWRISYDNVPAVISALRDDNPLIVKFLKTEYENWLVQQHLRDTYPDIYLEKK